MASQSAPYHGVAARFVLGSLISVAAWSGTMFAQVLGPPALLLPCLGFLIGGAIAGTALQQSLGAAVGFGVAFAIGNTGGMLSIMGTQAMTGLESLLIPFAVFYSMLFGIAGFIGLFTAGIRGRLLAIGVLSLAAGGLTTAVLVASLMNVHLIGGSPARAAVGFAIPMTLPWIGGVVIARALTGAEPRT